MDGVNIADKKIKMRDIPKKIGVVFQYPEYQFFEETVWYSAQLPPAGDGHFIQSSKYAAHFLRLQRRCFSRLNLYRTAHADGVSTGFVRYHMLYF